MFLHRFGKVKAPEFPKRLPWINSDPLSLRKLSGKVVLIDFWTYSCVNCVRTIPYVEEWHQRYKEKGLHVIGVHTPEFDFEKDQENVEQAVKDLEISYPVVLDAQYKIWNLYANRWWPRKFLIDAHGSIVYDHVGEGGYAETEQAIQKALLHIGAKELPPIKPDVSVGGGVCYRTTPEIYLGFLRGQFGNSEPFLPKEETVFSEFKEEKQEDIPYLYGHWKVLGDRLQHTRALAHPTEHLTIKYSGFSVNAVLATIGKKKTAEIEIELDGQPLPEDMAGEDVQIKKGKATVKVSHSKMYRLIDSDTYHKGTLRIKTASGNLEMYAFTFGGCKT